MGESTFSADHRYRAVMEIIAGAPVSQVAERYGVSRQSLHRWRNRYLKEGLDGLRERSRRPHRSPRRTLAAVESLICALREEQPGWGARRLLRELARRGVRPLPSPSTVQRVLARNGMVKPAARPVVPKADDRDRRIAELEREVRRHAELLSRAVVWAPPEGGRMGTAVNVESPCN